MSITYLNQGFERYYGLSTDEKPEVTPGSRFTEKDTTVTYVYTIDYGWIDERIFNNVITMSDIDYQTLAGNVYTSSNIYDPLTFGNSYITRLVTPNLTNKCVHVKSIFVGVEGASIKITLYNNVSITSGGFLVPNAFKQQNKNSSKIAGTKIYTSIPGNLIEFTGDSRRAKIIYGNTSPLSVASGTTQNIVGMEIVTMPNTDYILTIENVDQNEDTAYFINVITTILENQLCEI